MPERRRERPREAIPRERAPAVIEAVRTREGEYEATPGISPFQRDRIEEANRFIESMRGGRVKWLGLPIGRRMTPVVEQNLKNLVAERIRAGQIEGPGIFFRGTRGLVKHMLSDYKNNWLASEAGREEVSRIRDWMHRGQYEPQGMATQKQLVHWARNSAFALAHHPERPSLDSESAANRELALRILRSKKRTSWIHA